MKSIYSATHYFANIKTDQEHGNITKKLANTLTWINN
jgi:hypothetical protein